MNFLNTTELIFLHKIVKKSNPFAQVHRDLWGPLCIHTVMGIRWFVTVEYNEFIVYNLFFFFNIGHMYGS